MIYEKSSLLRTNDLPTLAESEKTLMLQEVQDEIRVQIC
jgi:hypothetical protein